jgi:glycosyltransferase involved in cell wall biosynthesis
VRVLLLHNRYRLLGGEERAVAETAKLLSDRGHEVQLLERSSDVPKARAARALIGGGEDISDALERYQPDVVHAHNLHPLLGWRSLAAAREAGARTVLHLHNFRLVCAIGIAYRDGAPCHRCHGSNTLPGVRLRCRGSLPEAATYAIGLHRQQPHLLEHADALVAVSAATASRLAALGILGAAVLPNFVREFAPESRAHEGEHALVSGRLVEEKGFDTAIAAAGAAGVPLLIAGDGPDEPRLRALAASADADVTFTGRLDAPALADARARAAVTLVPSRWEEPCPYSVLDSLADGVPVLASDRGGLPELVGRTVSPDGWGAALAELWADPELRRSRGEEGLARSRELFSPERYYESLMAVYRA